jgi:hypothetical protein
MSTKSTPLPKTETNAQALTLVRIVPAWANKNIIDLLDNRGKRKGSANG